MMWIQNHDDGTPDRGYMRDGTRILRVDMPESIIHSVVSHTNNVVGNVSEYIRTQHNNGNESARKQMNVCVCSGSLTVYVCWYGLDDSTPFNVCIHIAVVFGDSKVECCP